MVDCRLVDRLVGYTVVSWLVGRLVGFLVCSLFPWRFGSFYSLVNLCLHVHFLFGCLFGWLVDCLVVCWLPGCSLVGWLVV